MNVVAVKVSPFPDSDLMWLSAKTEIPGLNLIKQNDSAGYATNLASPHATLI
jgi:hypothetical protein